MTHPAVKLLTRSAKSSLLLLAAACATDGTGTVDPELETPRHAVVDGEGRFELRRYAPYVVAETVVDGDYDAAVRASFRILAGYIFGGNQARTKIAMTAPVASVPVEAPKGERIAMTAPVESSVSEPSTSGAPRWRTSFMMPSRYGLDTLPVPNDDRVSLVERPARCVAAVAFDGFVTDDIITARTTELLAWLKVRGISSTGTPTVARYNDPLTLPWNRRNEILVDVADDGCPAPAAAR